MRPALPLAALALATTLLLSGCVPQQPEVTPPPEPTTEPVFASDEEALAAATDAYKAYLKMSDLIAQEGGAKPERLAPYVTEEWLEQSIEYFDSFSKSGRHQSGESAIRSTALQQRYAEATGTNVVVIYACLDYSSVHVLDQDGMDTIPPDSDSLFAVEATLQTDTADLKLSANEPWAGEALC